ncbi:MAG: hypothetical protein GWO11_06090 [Desulfuromonadales bacterium]|nr:hypothetical protein [Desulfuromonadales bacterium]NIR33944.1 hypothetical protein [Desulfuromonadales bacterium]NIS42631.1 hypothetical protein [Desulfuromonadales bacterium]
MDVFSRLAAATRRQNEEGDLPDFIVPLLLKVADSPESFAGQTDQVETLVEYVEAYETFSEMCCEKLGYSLEDIHRVLNELRVSY